MECLKNMLKSQSSIVTGYEKGFPNHNGLGTSLFANVDVFWTIVLGLAVMHAGVMDLCEHGSNNLTKPLQLLQ